MKHRALGAALQKLLPKRIKVKIMLFMATVILISGLLASFFSIRIISQLYLEEIYLSSENSARQVLLSTDMTVQTIENSLSIILDSKSTTDLLENTNFLRIDGQVFEAYKLLDSSLDNFRKQFPKLDSLVFYSTSTGSYKYNYYQLLHPRRYGAI